MKIIINLLAVAMMIGSVWADQTQSGFKFGERPENSVFDPSGTLTVEEQKEISDPLIKIRDEEGIDIMVVVLDGIGSAPPLHVAKSFADKWADKEVNAVVLHVPGDPQTPWIFPGKAMGTALRPEAIRTTLTAAERRAASEPTDFGKVRSGSIEAADAMRYWLGSARLRTEEMITRRVEAQLAHEKRRNLLKLAGVLAAAAAIPLIVGGAFFLRRIREAGPRRFPEIRVVPRLGAPHAGGSAAFADPNQP